MSTYFDLYCYRLFSLRTCSNELSIFFFLIAQQRNKVKGNRTRGRLGTLRMTFLGQQGVNPNVSRAQGRTSCISHSEAGS